MDRTHQWKYLDDLGLLRRRPARARTDEMGGQEKQDIPKTIWGFSGMSGWGIRAISRKLNRGKWPKLATSEIEKWKNCDWPLGGEEWGEMSIERQRGALELMSLLKKGRQRGGKKRKAKRQ